VAYEPQKLDVVSLTMFEIAANWNEGELDHWPELEEVSESP